MLRTWDLLNIAASQLVLQENSYESMRCSLAKKPDMRRHVRDSPRAAPGRLLLCSQAMLLFSACSFDGSFIMMLVARIELPGSATLPEGSCRCPDKVRDCMFSQVWGLTLKVFSAYGC